MNAPITNPASIRTCLQLDATSHTAYSHAKLASVLATHPNLPCGNRTETALSHAALPRSATSAAYLARRQQRLTPLLACNVQQECTECGETRNATDHCDKSRINRCECILRQSIPRQNGHLPIWSAKPKAPIHLDPMRAIAVDTPHNMSEVTSSTCGHGMLILC